MPQCPSETELRDMLADRLPTEAMAAVESHVESCAACQQSMERLIAVPIPIRSNLDVDEADAAFLLRMAKNPLERTVGAASFAKLRTIGGPGRIDPPEIEGYEILEVLGQGGMGVVHKAWQTELKRFVALKMVLTDQAGGEGLARFRIEAEASARLQHPNIVQVHEVGERKGRPYLALEFVNGGSLAQKLNGSPLAPRDAARLVETLAHAMHYAHQRGIIHRDLKPSNILLSYGGDASQNGPLVSAVPKITDFGIAKLTIGGSDQTRTGSILGTPSYMAPEQAGGRTKDVSTAVDVYALGAILYELLTGRPPFRGATVAATLQQVLTEEPSSPRRDRPHLPRDLETICLKCLEKQPRQRYVGALDLAEDLRRFLADEPILARATPVWQHALKWARRRPAAAALAIVSALSAILLVAGSFWYQGRLQNLLGTVTEERDKARNARKDADVKRMEAEEQRDEAQRNLYLANNPLAHRAWEAGQLDRLTELLDAIGPRPPAFKDLRNFEWHYLRRLPANNMTSLIGHEAAVAAVTYRADGARIASADMNGMIRVWDADKCRELIPAFQAHRGRVALSYSPDGKHIASAGEDGRIRLWDAETGKLQREVGTHAAWAYHVAFRPDGKVLASASADETIKLWKLEGVGEPRTLTGHAQEVAIVAFSRDGKRLASGGADRLIRVWNLETRTEPTILNGHTGWVYGLAFNPDGRTLYSSSFDNTIRVWDANAGREIRKMVEHSGQIRGIAINEDGSRIASASYDRTVRIWDAAKGLQLLSFKGHHGKVNAVAFRPDGRHVASVGDDRTVRVWDIGGPQDFRAGPRHDRGPVNVVAFSPDKQRLVSGGADSRIQIWNLAENKQEPPLIGAAGPVHALAFHPEGKLLASGGVDSPIRIWDIAQRQTVRVLEGHTDRVTALTYGSRGSLASASYDGTVRLWPASKGEPRIILAHEGRALGVAFAPGESSLVSCGNDKMVYLWDPLTGARRNAYEGHDGWVYCVAISPDGKWLASGGANGAVLVWDLASAKLRFRLPGHDSRVNSLAFTPDSLRLASIGFFDKSVKVWDMTRGQELLTLNHQSNGHAVAFSPDGHLLASTGSDSVVRVWDGTPSDK